MTTAATETEFVIARVFDAPRKLVWKAWTEPERLGQWWGPKGCKIRVIKLDLRPGGIFHYAMQFKPGHDMFGRFIFREIVAPERLVFVNSFSDAEGGITRAPFSQLEQKWPLEVLNNVTLSEQNGKTTLTLRGAPDQRDRGRAQDVCRLCTARCDRASAARSISSPNTWRSPADRSFATSKHHWKTEEKTMQTAARAAPTSNAAIWAGRIMSGLVIAFLLLDGAMKLIPLDIVVVTSEQLGIPASLARTLGVLTLVCTILYAIPRTSVLGAILLTGYLGGAIYTHLRVGSPIFTHLLFGVYLGLMIWGGLYLRDERLRALIPITR